jgi:ATP-binding cassette subfamily B protein IrtB
MISTLLRVLGHEYAGPVRRTVALMTATALAEGLSYALLVPVLRALFGSTPEDARPWLAAFGAAVAVYAVLRYASDRSGFRVGTTMLHGMYERLGEHLARLPIGWYQPGRTGEMSVLASQGVLQAMSVIAHLLAPFISACVTPLTILAVMFAFNWQLGLAGLAAVPLVVAVQQRTARATTATDTERVEREREATGRVIEYLQAQPVLRAGGRTGERFGLLDDSLKELSRASRRSTLSALPGVLGLAVTVQAVFTALLALGAYLALGGDIGEIGRAHV